MEPTTQYTLQNLNSDYRFIRVVSRDGVFFELIRKWRVREHTYRRQQKYPAATSMERTLVPPCLLRDFTALQGPEVWTHASWRGGTCELLPLSPQDRILVANWLAAKR